MCATSRSNQSWSSCCLWPAWGWWWLKDRTRNMGQSEGGSCLSETVPELNQSSCADRPGKALICSWQTLGMVLRPIKSLRSKLETKSADNFGSIHQNISWDLRARMDWNTPNETLLCGVTIIPRWMTTTVCHGWVQVQVYFWFQMLWWRLLFGFERFWEACSEEDGCVADNYCNVFSSYWCNLTGWIIFNSAWCTP